MLNSLKFFGDIEGNVKAYLIEDTADYDQPLISYQASTGSSTTNPPNQVQIIVPAS